MPLFADGLAVKIGTYELPLGRWGEEADVEFDHRLVENQRKHKWNLTGKITAASIATYVAALEGLKTVAGTQGQDVVVTWGGEEIAALRAADCADGPMISRFQLPESGEKFATVQPVEIEIEAVEETAEGDLLEDEYTTTYRTDNEGLSTIAIRGKFRTKKTVSAQTIWTTTKIPAIPLGMSRQNLEVDFDDQDRDCSYRVEDKTITGEIESEEGSNCEVHEEVTKDAQGRTEKTRSGWFTGLTALAQVNALRPKVGAEERRLLHESIRRNLITGRVEFTFRYLDMEDEAIVSWESSVTKSGGGQVKEIIGLAGTTPFILNGALQVYRVEYSGSATGARAYPEAPNPPYPTVNLAEPPEIVRDDSEPEIRRISWRYRYIFETDPGGPILLARPN